MLACLVCADMRPAPYIENMVSIYQSLDAAFIANVSQSLSSGKDMFYHQNLFFFKMILVIMTCLLNFGFNCALLALITLPAVGRSLEQSPVSVSSAQGKSSKDMQSDKGVMSNPCLNKRLMQRGGHRMHLNGQNGSNPLPTSVLAGNMTDGRPLAEEIDVNQLPQQSPISYLSSDDNKDVDGNTCDLVNF